MTEKQMICPITMFEKAAAICGYSLTIIYQYRNPGALGVWVWTLGESPQQATLQSGPHRSTYLGGYTHLAGQAAIKQELHTSAMATKTGAWPGLSSWFGSQTETSRKIHLHLFWDSSMESGKWLIGHGQPGMM